MVTVARSLSGDDSEEYRLRVRVSDGGVPSRTNSTIVRIRVRRNICQPTFNVGSRTYTYEIPETQVLGKY